MNKNAMLLHGLMAIAVIAALSISTRVFAVDAAAAETLARQQNCLKCHSIDKKKEGPTFKEVAAKYKDKSDAEERLYKHITTGEMAKFPDGREEAHKVIKANEADTRNLLQWILAR